MAMQRTTSSAFSRLPKATLPEQHAEQHPHMPHHMPPVSLKSETLSSPTTYTTTFTVTDTRRHTRSAVSSSTLFASSSSGPQPLELATKKGNTSSLSDRLRARVELSRLEQTATPTTALNKCRGDIDMVFQQQAAKLRAQATVTTWSDRQKKATVSGRSTAVMSRYEIQSLKMLVVESERYQKLQGMTILHDCILTRLTMCGNEAAMPKVHESVILVKDLTKAAHLGTPIELLRQCILGLPLWQADRRR